MDIIRKLQAEISQCINNCFNITAESYNFTVESPKNQDNGDLSSNIAMILSKTLRKNPKEIAEIINKWLNENTNYKSIEIAGPGFINIHLSSNQWKEALEQVENQEIYNVKTNNTQKLKVNLEFASPNPTGPMHIGHARGAIYGQVLSNILQKVGYQVDREYYINDAGNQIALLALSVIARVREMCALPFKIPEDGYPGEYLIPIANKALKEFGKEQLLTDNPLNDNEFSERLNKFIIDEIMLMIKDDLSKLGVHHNVFTSEKYDVLQKHYIEKAIEILRKESLIYEGTLEAPKGKVDENWEERKQLLFKSTESGDDVDRPLFKPNGSHTYFAGDVGYHYHKVMRGYNIMLLALGADHSGYIKRITACVKGLAPNVEFKVLLFQLVKFMKDGKPYKMSKRSGNFITVDDVLKEIDVDSLKFLMLNAKNDTTLAIDFTKAKEQSKDNPVFYVQYAHARCCSLRRKFDNIEIATPTDLTYNFNIYEKELIKLIHSYTRVLMSAAKSFEPLKLINYLIDIASKFHSLWNMEGYYFIDDKLSIAEKYVRVNLVKGVLNTIKEVFLLLNIKGLERM